MIMYRPHRGGLDAAMKEAKEFKSLSNLLDWIVAEHNYTCPFFQISRNDLYIEPRKESDERVGWHDMFWICFERYSVIKDKNGYKKYFGIRPDEELDEDDHPCGVFGSFTTDYERKYKWQVNM